MPWTQRRDTLQGLDEIGELLESLHNNKYVPLPTNPPPALAPAVNSPEQLSLGVFLLRVLFSITVHTAWLFWRLPVWLWIMPYYNYVRYSMNSRLTWTSVAAAWLVCCVDHDPLKFTTSGRPVGVRFTLSDIYQLWYLLAAPVLYRTTFQLLRFLTGIYIKAAEGLGNAFGTGLHIPNYILDYYQRTPPAAASDAAFRLLLTDERLYRVEAKVNGTNHKKRRNLLFEKDSAHHGWDVYCRSTKFENARRRRHKEVTGRSPRLSQRKVHTD
jgi:hypothetical protein